MFNHKNHSTLNTTKSDTSRLISSYAILRDSISNISLKYSTSQTYYMIGNINQAVQNKKCRLKQIMKDQEFNRQEEILQKYNTLEQVETQLPQLTEYYKYYTQTSIIYQHNFFKLMHHHREKRKIIEYNRLKILLNLSDTTQRSDISDKNKKNSTPISSFYILSKLNLSITSRDEQSQTLANLNCKLQKTLGPNCFRTVQQLDRNYHFQKKIIDNSSNLDIKCFKKIKMAKYQKQNFNYQSKNSKAKCKKRNNSCQFLNTPPHSKKMQLKSKGSGKKKNFSMDNLHTLMKDYQSKQSKTKMYGNWIKNAENHSSKEESTKSKLRNSQEKIKSEYNENQYDIRTKILDTKQRIRKEKLQLKKKNILTTNQSETIKSTKKSPFLQIQPQEKHKNRKLMKITFF